MVRGKMMEKGVGRTGNFRWRSHEITRIEGFSDAVFAFAVTLLFVVLFFVYPIKFLFTNPAFCPPMPEP